MLANEVATYLAGAGLGLSLGTNLFAVPFPEAAQDNAACIETSPGRASDRTFGTGPQAPLGEYATFTVIVRDTKERAAQAEQLAHDIYKKLDNLGPVTLSGIVYRDVRAMQGPPWFLDFDGSNRPLYVCSFDADKDRSA